jgi:NitT/TauT family transport system permease protein
MRGGKWLWIALFCALYLFVLSKAWVFPETRLLPAYAIASLSRLIVTYLLCLAFGLAVGIYAAMNKRAGDIIIPLLDILQSVPVLAVFPFAILFIVPVFGMQVAAIIALFMGMAWSIVFGVIAGVKAIPQHLQDMAAIFGLRRWEYIKHIVLPSIYPSLIAGSILAFGSGWYFIIASEFITYGATTYTTPGLGYYLNLATFHYADIWMSLAGFLTIAIIVFTIHQLVWKKLDKNARQAKFLTLHFGYDKGLDLPAHISGTHTHRRIHFNRRHAHQWFFNIFRFDPTIYIMLLVIMLGLGFILSWTVSTVVLYTPAEVFLLLLSSFARILIAYALAMALAVLVGYLLIRKPATRGYLMPICDVLQSIPAIAYFPTLFLVLTTLLPITIGMHIASILLLMTGMLWYMLFNIMEAVEHLPRDINEIADLYDIEGGSYIKNILVPAMFPALVTGSILAFGGGWNSIIVSEYVNLGGTIYSVPGIGSAMDYATINVGSTPTLIMLLFVMTGTVLLLNHFVWRRLLNRASKYVLEED